MFLLFASLGPYCNSKSGGGRNFFLKAWNRTSAIKEKIITNKLTLKSVLLMELFIFDSVVVDLV